MHETSLKSAKHQNDTHSTASVVGPAEYFSAIALADSVAVSTAGRAATVESVDTPPTSWADSGCCGTDPSAEAVARAITSPS